MNFGVEFLQFFKDLTNNNSRDWFQAHRNTYLRQVKQPFSELVEEMIARIQSIDPEVRIEAKEAIFRINRDLRFSKDKTHAKPMFQRRLPKEVRSPTFPVFISDSGPKSCGLWVAFIRSKKKT